MIKKYCDICKEEIVTDEEYLLPSKERFWKIGKFNQPIQSEYIYKARRKDLCSTCAAHLCDFIENYASIMSNKK